jgi:hypothetical protein
MHMSIIWVISVVLALLPLLMAGYFLEVTLERKKVAVKQDLGKLRTNTFTQGSLRSGKIASDQDIDDLVEKFYRKSTLSVPAFLLTIFYASAFILGDTYLNQKFNSGNPWFFSKALIDIAAPVLYTFVGVYLFNLGNFIRRIYLGDLNEQVFWGAINRFWLSIGLSLVVQKAGFPLAAQPGIFFSIGFLANIVLDWVLDGTLKALNFTQPSSQDLPLRMVKGIDIWKAYRLEEEGIENVQNLATADITELTVRTHYNYRTLIDWIDQALLLVRLNADQAKILTSQATAISAIELAAASPRASGNNAVANALATALKIDPVLMGATMDRLYEDEFVQTLWNLWQSGEEGGTVPPPTPPGGGGGAGAPAGPPPMAAAAAAGAAGGQNAPPPTTTPAAGTRAAINTPTGTGNTESRPDSATSGEKQER